MARVNFHNFIPKYLLHPLDKELSHQDRVVCAIASVGLGILTLGLLHLGVAIYQTWSRHVANRTASPNALQAKVSSAASKGLQAQASSKPSQQNDLTAQYRKARRLIRDGSRQYNPEIGGKMDLLLKSYKDPNALQDPYMGGNLMHDLAKLGRPIELVQILAANGVDFNAQDKTGHTPERAGNTPLLWAIANANNEMALEILNYKQDLDIKGLGNAALHLAIAKGYKDRSYHGDAITVPNLVLVEKLLRQGADPNLRNGEGHTPLHIACMRRDLDMIKALVREGADLSTPSPEGKTCLELLEMTHSEVSNEMKRLAGAWLLPKADFDADHDACVQFVEDKMGHLT